MNGVGLLPLLLLACAGGYLVARPAGDADRPGWRCGLATPGAIILVGAVIAAAEAGSATARYLALFAVFVASAAAILMVGIRERRWPPAAPATDEADEA